MSASEKIKKLMRQWKQNPKDIPVLRELAVIYQRLGLVKEARLWALRMLEVDTGSQEARMLVKARLPFRVLNLLNQNREDEAIERLTTETSCERPEAMRFVHVLRESNLAPPAPSPGPIGGHGAPLPGEVLESVVSFSNVCMSYGRRNVLNNVSFDVLGRRLTAIAGGSDTGKTTILRLILGMCQPDSGTVSVFGRDIAGLAEKEMNQLRMRTGYQPQKGMVWNSEIARTAGENVRVPIQEHFPLLGNDTIEIMVQMKLELVGLPTFRDTPVSQLGEGGRRRTGLARALALDPQLLLCDEPTSGLDPIHAQEIARLLRHLCDALNLTIVIATHDMLLYSISDYLILLGTGDRHGGEGWEGTRVVYDGPPEGMRRM